MLLLAAQVFSFRFESSLSTGSSRALTKASDIQTWVDGDDETLTQIDDLLIDVCNGIQMYHLFWCC